LSVFVVEGERIMQKKALLVGVGDYGDYAPPLVSPITDVNRWADLFKRKYQFPDVTTLTDGYATADEVLKAFRKLVTGAKAGDLIIFTYQGHGKIVRAHQKGPFPTEQALIVSPRRGDTQLKGAEITDSDVTKIVIEEHVPAGTLIAFVLVTCFSAAFDPSKLQGTSLALYSEHKEVDLRKTREFGSFGAQPAGFNLDRVELYAKRPTRSRKLDAPIEEPVIPRPIIVAATGRDQTAVEDRATGRMFFSERAIDYLWGHDGATFASLVSDIQPLLAGVNAQTPELRGNTARKSELFPGGTPPLAQDSPKGFALPSPENGGAMYTIDIRFQGICCFADPSVTGAPYKKRVLMPYDDRAADDPLKHFAFLEIAADQVDWWSGLEPDPPGPHVVGGVDFLRWDLNGHRITFDNTIDSGFQTTDSFRYHVPGMRNDVFNQLDYYARDECFHPYPPPALIGGFADITTGTLAAGPLQNVAVKFIRDLSQDVTWVGRATKFVELRLEIADPQAIIKLNDGRVETTIKLRQGASALIGNMRDVDILEDPGAGDDPRDSFWLFYKLSRWILTDPPMPTSDAVPIDGCSSTGWP
jgi:hypothetical protein